MMEKRELETIDVIEKNKHQISNIKIMGTKLTLLFTIIFCLVISSTFIPYKIVDNYFQLFPIACSVGILIVISCILLIAHYKTSLNFSIPDFIILITIAYYLLIYDFQDQLANWKIIYAVLLIIFWFASRIIFSYYPISNKTLIYGVVLMGCIQSIWGILQLYGVIRSYHNIYAVTGSFYNPGPYTGYIAVIFPICLGQLLNARRAEIYFWAIPAAILFCMIPAGLSRSAWGALIISSLFILFTHFNWKNKIRQYYKIHLKKFICYTIFLTLTSITLFVLFVTMKPDSAYGRLFIWKNTLSVIAKSPIYGHGPGSFPAKYGQQQSNYFAQNNYSDWEERVAGTPEYAFNEYLQLAVEGGIILLLLVCIFIYLTFREGLRKKQYSVCGGLLSLCVFSFSSYPMQILPFGIIGILLSSLCISNYNKKEQCKIYSRLSTWFTGICILIISIVTIYRLKDSSIYKERVFYTQSLYSANNYQEAFSAYEMIYEKIWHNPRLLLNYANMLSKQNQYAQAIEILERAEKVSCEVSILNTKAFCYQQLGNYKQAESIYKESINRLPIRIYPYYMLTKLYADSAYYDRKKLEDMATIVLTKKPKVYSNVISDMKNEIKKLSIELKIN